VRHIIITNVIYFKISANVREKSTLLHCNVIVKSQFTLQHVSLEWKSTREITVMAISALVAQTRERTVNVSIYRHIYAIRIIIAFVDHYWHDVCHVILLRSHLATLKETAMMKPVVLEPNIILFQFCQVFLQSVCAHKYSFLDY